MNPKKKITRQRKNRTLQRKNRTLQRKKRTRQHKKITRQHKKITRQRKNRTRQRKNRTRQHKKITRQRKNRTRQHKKITHNKAGHPGDDWVEAGGKYQLFTDVDDTLHPAGYGALGWLEIAGVDKEGNRIEYYKCAKELHQWFYKKFGLPTVVVSANPLTSTEKGSKKYTDALELPVEYMGGQKIASLISVLTNLTPQRTLDLSMFHGPALDERENLHYNRMALVKINHIIEKVREMRAIYGDDMYRAIWIGDNGQGDLLAANALLEQNIIYAALIHHVNPKKKSGKGSRWYNEGMLYPFINYFDAINWLKNLSGLETLDICTKFLSPTLHQLIRQKSFDAAVSPPYIGPLVRRKSRMFDDVDPQYDDEKKE